MATIKKKVNIFKNKFPKKKKKKTQNKFSQEKVLNNQETGERIVDIHKKKENQKSGEIRKRGKSVERKSL